jgi:hypothetical protein
MKKIFTYSQARQNLASVLLQADQDGEVTITHRDGRKYIVKAAKTNRSPLDVPCISKNLSREEILDSIREGREMDYMDRTTVYTKKETK